MQKLMVENNSYDLVQLIDVSAQVMFDRVIAEKKLLAIINATVSHEMRNPINSIRSQLIQQDILNK